MMVSFLRYWAPLAAVPPPNVSLVQFSLFSMLFCALPSLFFMHCAKTLSFVYASLNIFIFSKLFLDQRKVKSDFRRKF